MPESVFSLIGGVAAVLTTLAYIPQLIKAWPSGSTDDLSLGMLLALDSGLMLWIVYGVFKQDWVIIGANAVGASLVFVVLLCKLRDLRHG